MKKLLIAGIFFMACFEAFTSSLFGSALFVSGRKIADISFYLDNSFYISIVIKVTLVFLFCFLLYEKMEREFAWLLSSHAIFWGYAFLTLLGIVNLYCYNM